MKKIGYSDFIRICQIERVDTWCDWLSLREDGVYIKKPDDDFVLTPDERAVLTEHPTGNLNEPALSFPCDVSTLMNFLEKQAIGVAIDDVVDYQERVTPESANSHKLQSRVRLLDAEVCIAKDRALNRDDVNSVWTELIKMAQNKEGSLIGYVSEGLQYRGKKYQETGDFDVFTRKALGKKMRRDKARQSSIRHDKAR